MAVYGLIFLLMVTNSLALWNPHFEPRNWSPSRARATECTGTGTICASCTEACFCTGAGATPVPLPCGTEQVCVENGPLQAACTAYSGATAGDCDCDTISNSGFLVDPFDSSKYILCTPPEQQYFLSCADGETFSTTENQCVTAPTTPAATTTPPTTTPAVTTTPLETTEDASAPGGVEQKDSSTDDEFCGENGIGLHTDDPTCQTYTVCFSATLPGLLLECNAGEVFDATALICVPQCDLAPAAFSCPSDAAGALPDTVDCSIFHVCSNGQQVTPAGGISCPDGEVFEPESMTCIAETADAVCPETNSCWAAYCESCGGTSCPVVESPSTADSGPSDDSTGDTSPAGGNSDDSTGATSPATTDDNSGGGNSEESTDDTTAATSTTTTTTPEITSTTTELTSTPELTTTPTTTSSTTTTTPIATTTGPPDCGDAPGVYEDTSDCSQFYQCEADDAGLYEAVLFSCPSPLVFVPSLGYCFLQSSLPEAPGCIAS